MDKESKQQRHQLTETVTALGATVTTLTESVASLTSSVADLKAEMREGFAKVDEQFVEVKQGQATRLEDIANLQDSNYNLSINLDDLDRRMSIGFTKTTEQISVLKRDIIEINCELFLECGIHQTEVNGLRQHSDETATGLHKLLDKRVADIKQRLRKAA